MSRPWPSQQPPEQREQTVELVGREILRDRMQHHDVERSCRQRGDFVRRAHLDPGIAGEAFGERAAHHRRGLAQDQPPRGRRDDVGVERLAAAVVEHDCA